MYNARFPGEPGQPVPPATEKLWKLVPVYELMPKMMVKPECGPMPNMMTLRSAYYRTPIGKPCQKSDPPVSMVIWSSEVAETILRPLSVSQKLAKQSALYCSLLSRYNMEHSGTYSLYLSYSETKQPSIIELWFLRNVNRKSQAACHLPRTSVLPDMQYHLFYVVAFVFVAVFIVFIVCSV